MRFQVSPTSPPPKAGMTRRQRSQVWLLLLALGMVLLAIRYLEKPSTARRLGQLFGMQEKQTDTPIIAPQIISGAGVTSHPMSEANGSVEHFETLQSKEKVDERVPGLSFVKDRTYFRPSEKEAWFNLFANLKKQEASEVKHASLGLVTYVQFLKQPDEYRGRLVTIRGTALREEIVPAEKNDLAIDSYHRLWVQPQGGGPSLMVAYCLQLPTGFPEGDDLRCQVEITGYFFKNWSYAWDKGLALAPAILVNHFSWKPTKKNTMTEPVADSTVLLAIGGACLLGLVVAVFLFRYSGNSRRRTRTKDVPLELPTGWKADSQNKVDAQSRSTGTEGGE